MKNQMKKLAVELGKVMVLLALVWVGIGVVEAQIWTPPNGTPPNNNVSAPVNVGDVLQEKGGGLHIGKTSTLSSANRLLTAHGIANFGSGLFSKGSYALPAGPYTVDVKEELMVGVDGNIGADQYCNKDGSKCARIDELMQTPETEGYTCNLLYDSTSAPSSSQIATINAKSATNSSIPPYSANLYRVVSARPLWQSVNMPSSCIVTGVGEEADGSCVIKQETYLWPSDKTSTYYATDVGKLEATRYVAYSQDAADNWWTDYARTTGYSNGPTTSTPGGVSHSLNIIKPILHSSGSLILGLRDDGPIANTGEAACSGTCEGKTLASRRTKWSSFDNSARHGHKLYVCTQ